jgi:SAM-dependent methyltransferase
MLRLTDWVHLALAAHLRPGDRCLDATLGNGHDALHLAGLVGPGGRVHGLDLQPAALEASRTRLGAHPAFLPRLGDHAELDRLLPAEDRGRLRAVVFNLGFLPGSDHAIVTRARSSVRALEAARAWLAPDGALVCTCYPGHEHGPEEAVAVTGWFEERAREGDRVTRIGRVATRGAAPFLHWLEAGGTTA